MNLLILPFRLLKEDETRIVVSCYLRTVPGIAVTGVPVTGVAVPVVAVPVLSALLLLIATTASGTAPPGSAFRDKQCT